MKPRQLLMLVVMCVAFCAFALQTAKVIPLQPPVQTSIDNPTIEQLQQDNYELQQQFNMLEKDVEAFHADNKKNDTVDHVLVIASIVMSIVSLILSIIGLVYAYNRLYKVKYTNELKFRDLYSKIECKFEELQVYYNDKIIRENDMLSKKNIYPREENNKNDDDLFYSALSAKKTLSAIELYTEAIRINPNNSSAFNNRGVMRIQTGDFFEAINDFNKAIELNPNSATAYINRGAVKAKIGDIESAMNDYQMAISLNPKSSIAFYNLGTLNFKIRRYHDAEKCFEKALELNPACSEAYIYRGCMQSYSEAIKDFTTAIELNPFLFKESDRVIGRKEFLDKFEHYQKYLSEEDLNRMMWFVVSNQNKQTEADSEDEEEGRNLPIVLKLGLIDESTY